LIALLLSATVAFGCGQTTHIWTAIHAVDHLPAGSLKDALTDPAGRRALISGTMFPDGGYSPLVGHPYGETAHWEPFQDRYLTWVQDNQLGDVQHEAFLYGLAAHGMGDQLFDAMYLYRGDEGQPDEDTDIIMASLWGGHAPNEHFVPYDALVPLFADAGIDVDADTLRSGMSSLDFAVYYVGAAAENDERVAQAREDYPWTTSHLEDQSIPGAPACIGKTLALYWLVLEQRLLGASPPLVLTTFPEDQGYSHPTQGRDAMVSVVFSRAMEEETVEAAGVAVLTGPEGIVPTDVWLYYRQGSHVLNVLPLDDLATGSTYELTVNPGPTGIGGEQLDEPWSMSFSTGPPPEPEPEQDPEPNGCGCHAAPLPVSGGLLALFMLVGTRRLAGP